MILIGKEISLTNQLDLIPGDLAGRTRAVFGSQGDKNVP